MRYLVSASEGPSFASIEEAVEVLEQMVIPTFERLEELEGEGRLQGGLPVGERAFVFVIEAGSHDDVDRLLREFPLWGFMEWEVTPLQTFGGRTAQEREFLRDSRESF